MNKSLWESCIIDIFRSFAIDLNSTTQQENRSGLERYFPPLEFGTNPEFLTQRMKKRWPNECQARNGCCEGCAKLIVPYTSIVMIIYIYQVLHTAVDPEMVISNLSQFFIIIDIIWSLFSEEKKTFFRCEVTVSRPRDEFCIFKKISTIYIDFIMCGLSCFLYFCIPMAHAKRLHFLYFISTRFISTLRLGFAIF